jgi:small subunit ribosomal protein S18
VSYVDVATLRTFLSDRGRIRARRVTGLDPHEHRQVARAIKTAREMALLPHPTRGR